MPNLEVWGLDQNLSGPADRNPNFLYSRIGALQEITYPTGGKLAYDYESHLTNIIGGLRVKEQHLVTGQDTITKSFEYNNAFYLLIRPELYTFKSMYLESFEYPCYAIFEKFTFTSDPCLNLEFEGKTALYSEVTEYLSKQGETAGKKIYYYDLQTKNLNYSIETDVNDILGYPFDGACCYGQQYYTGSLYFKTFKFGEALNTQTLFYDNNDRLVKGLNYYYSSQVYDTINGLNVTRQYNSNGISWGDKNYHFAYSSYYLYQVNQQLDSIITHNYFTSDGQEMELKEKQYFTYNTKKMPILIGKTTSAGEVLFTKYKYPTDYSSFPYSNMTERNIVNPLIERRDSIFRNGVGQLLAIERTDYNLWGQHGYKPEFIKESILETPLQIKARFDYDPDLLNITSITRRDEMVQSIIWGYNNSYPIARAENAIQTEIAYTGFEKNGEYGGWIYQSGTPLANYSKTGRYSLVNAIMQRVVNVNSIISVWVKNNGGTPIVSGYTPITYSSSDGWTYYEWYVNPGSITVNGSNCNIDDLRLYPVGSLMTTYTYDPLIGMTSETGYNGNSTYYEYDSTGRLVNVRDNSRNILKQIKYNYAQ